MNLEAELFNALKVLVPGERVYQDIFPQPPSLPTWPAIRFTLVSGVNQADICGTGDVDTDDVTYQIDVVAETAQQVKAVTDLVIATMRNVFPHPNVRVGLRSDPFDVSTKTYRRSLDYQVQLSST